MAIVAIKGKSSSSKSLFPNHSMHPCLMEKEGKKKVNPKASSSAKYISSDDDTLSSDENTLSNDNDEPLPNDFFANNLMK
jgi:hypothetical protein